jgi:hypothetical protein
MKTLNEYINESLLDDLEDLEKDSDDSIENVLIEKFLKENYSITGQYTIKDGIVDVNGSVIIKNRKINNLTNGMFVFGKIYKYFDCSGCDKLKSLKGAPKEVGLAFTCHNCKFLISLEGAPEKVGGRFICSNCSQLKSLEGAPKELKGDFLCTYCRSLKTLKGAPENIGGSFYCAFCKSLTSLEGAPKEVGGSFYCQGCAFLTSLEGAPKEVGVDFHCNDCGTSFTKEYVKSLSNVKPNNIYV